MYIYLNIKQKNRSHPSLDHRIATAAPLTSGVAGLLQQPPAQAGVGQAAAREDGERDGALLGLPAVPSRAAEEDRWEDGAEGGARTQPRVSKPLRPPTPEREVLIQRIIHNHDMHSIWLYLFERTSTPLSSPPYISPPAAAFSISVMIDFYM